MDAGQPMDSVYKKKSVASKSQAFTTSSLALRDGQVFSDGKACCGRHGAHSLGLPAVSVSLVPSLFDPCDCLEMWLHSKGGGAVRPAGGRTAAKGAGQGIGKGISTGAGKTSTEFNSRSSARNFQP